MKFSVCIGQTYSPEIRFNAIAPDFFMGEQNRQLLMNENGSPTTRGQSIIFHAPMAQFEFPKICLARSYGLFHRPLAR